MEVSSPPFFYVAFRDPDNVVLCLLATDDEEDVALQIHFTLIQAFCCENDINILRVGNMRRLAEILGGGKPGGEPMDLHCVLVTVSVIAHVRSPLDLLYNVPYPMSNQLYQGFIAAHFKFLEGTADTIGYTM